MHRMRPYRRPTGETERPQQQLPAAPGSAKIVRMAGRGLLRDTGQGTLKMQRWPTSPVDPYAALKSHRSTGQSLTACVPESGRRHE